MPGTESIIDPVTGELCYRGRHIFMGYMFMPDKTAETIDEDGYLHSGDVAQFDSDNNPRIQGPSGFMKVHRKLTSNTLHPTPNTQQNLNLTPRKLMLLKT